MTADYSIWMLEYARIPHQSTEAAFSGYVRPGETMPFSFAFVLVQGGGHNILIDCGVDFRSATKRRMAEEFGLVGSLSATDALDRVGVSASEIDVIIPTHAHWDHMGGLEAFPEATVYLQRAELDGWRTLLDRSSAYAAVRSAVDADDINTAERLRDEGRLVLLDGEERDVLPGIHIWVDLAGHSHASQLVLIESDASGEVDRFIAIGDVAYAMENLTGVPEFPHFIPNTKWAVGGAYSTMVTYERILEYVRDDHFRILIEHDVATWTRHPSITFRDGLHLAEVRVAAGETSKLGRPELGKEMR